MYLWHPPGSVYEGGPRGEGEYEEVQRAWDLPASVGVVAMAGAPGRWSEGQAESPVGQL